MAVLDLIQQANDIKKLTPEQLPTLASEVRDFLIENISRTGGHIASNLGAVELTLALHYVLDFPEDKLIWDVGHQAYTHKLLTGRRDGFENLRQLDGMSGFPKRSESDCDCFNTGHSSTSISAGLGYASARDLMGEDYSVVSVIGDGALTGGLAYEALNNAADLKTNFIIVLNDNKMSISENVGGLSRHLSSLRTADAYQEFKSGVHSSLSRMPYGERVARRMHKTKSSLKQLLIPGMIFENIGVTYLGPVDGHNIYDMIQILREAKKVSGAVVVHMMTDKGKGYLPAQQAPAKFHGIGAFDPETGELLKKKEKANYTDVFSATICKIAEKNPKVVALTAAMSDGTGLRKFRSEYPDRFFDVGIAEGHAVTFSAGMAAAGLHPVFAVYSSFLQRGFDEIVHDVCMQNLPVTFAIDRAGLVGADGETHQGLLDISYLTILPNMVVMAPKNKWELARMLWFATRYEGPVAIRYPRGTAYDGLKEYDQPIELGKCEWITKESEIALFAYGNMVEIAMDVHERLKEAGIPCSVINARFAKPIDEEAIREAANEHTLFVTMEENMLQGGMGSAVERFVVDQKIPMNLKMIGIDDHFVEQGSVPQLQKRNHLDADSVAEEIIKEYNRNNEA